MWRQRVALVVAAVGLTCVTVPLVAQSPLARSLTLADAVRAALDHDSRI
jgi:hypothetical protein